MNPGFLVPVYRHIITAGAVAQKLAAFNLPIIIVDDGNGDEGKIRLAEISSKIPKIIFISLKKNIGKGGAFAKGLEKAAELGLSHVFQIDADDQHDLERISFFLGKSPQGIQKKLFAAFPYLTKLLQKAE